MKRYTLYDLARLVDHTNLHADATRADMEKLCDEAKRYHFRMVAINSVQSRLCSELLAGTDVHVGAAIGFPPRPDLDCDQGVRDARRDCKRRQRD